MTNAGEMIILAAFYGDLIVIVLIGGLCFLSVGVAHLYLVPFIALFVRRKDAPDIKVIDFLILVPAHNEEAGIADTLRALFQMESSGLTKIVVIADNCSDNTANVARDCGATVIERDDPVNRGKGFALRFGLEQCQFDQFGAVVIVDADTIVDSNMLIAMSKSFSRGAGAVQVANQFSMPKASALARLQQMANQVENILFYSARSRLGLGVLLRGTGMAIRSDILLSHPWDSFSVTEDVDYSIGLLRDKIKIAFTRQSAVKSAATANYGDSFEQKQRWASGTFNLISDRTRTLLITGLKDKRFDLIELAFSLLLLSRPTLIMFGLVLFGLSFFFGDNYQTLFIWWSLGLISLLVLYLVSGVFFVREKFACLLSLFQLPFFGVWLIAVQSAALWRRRKLGWVRTRRNDE